MVSGYSRSCFVFLCDQDKGHEAIWWKATCSLPDAVNFKQSTASSVQKFFLDEY